jgi:putative intracellular protease/amidase
MKVYLVVVDRLADWEIGYLTAELHSRRFFADPSRDFQLLKAGMSRDVVTSMGGVSHTPDLAIDDIRMDRNDLLLLPGADIWQSAQARPALELARNALDHGHQVAAICGATIGLASIGALNARRHTSNDLGLLKASCPDYRGEHLYRKEPAVRGDNLVTATGLAPLEFSYEVLKMLKVWKPETAKAWYRLHKTRQERWYHELVASMSDTPAMSS